MILPQGSGFSNGSKSFRFAVLPVLSVPLISSHCFRGKEGDIQTISIQNGGD